MTLVGLQLLIMYCKHTVRWLPYSRACSWSVLTSGGSSSLHRRSRSTTATFISSALITSFLCNQIAPWLGELSRSLIPFQSAPHQTANCPLIQSTASLAALVHLLPGAPAKSLIWPLAICPHQKTSNVPHGPAADCRDGIEPTPFQSILAVIEITKFP